MIRGDDLPGFLGSFGITEELQILLAEGVYPAIATLCIVVLDPVPLGT